MPNNNQSEERERIVGEFYSTFAGNKFEASYKKLKQVEDGKVAPYFIEDWLKETLTTHGASEYARGKREGQTRELELLATHLDRQLYDYTNVRVDSVYGYIEQRLQALSQENTLKE